MTNREDLLQVLRREFPGMWTKYSEQFDGRKGAIWTGEGSSSKEDESLFNINRDDSQDDSQYEMGVYKPLVQVLDQHRWFAEFADGGTVFIYPND